MSTTIRITDEDRSRLAEVQSRLTHLTGRRMTLQEVVGRMAQHAQSEPEHLLGDEWAPMTPGEMAAQDARIKALGGWNDSWEDIDAVVYDEP